MKYLKELKYESIDQILWVSITTEAIEKELTEESPYFEAWQQKTDWDDKITNIDEVLARYKERAGLYKEFSFIKNISYGRCVDGMLKVKEIASNEEKQLIEEFFADVEKFVAGGVKFIGGFGALNFTVPFVSFRATVNDIPTIPSFDIGGIPPWGIKHVIDVQNLLRGSSTTGISLLGAAAALNIHYSEADINFTVVKIFCKYTNQPQPTEVIRAGKVEVKEVPLLERLYQTNSFSADIKQGLEKLLKKKKITAKDKEAIKEIIYSVYVRTSFATNDEDKKEVKEQKQKEVEDFINSL